MESPSQRCTTKVRWEREQEGLVVDDHPREDRVSPFPSLDSRVQTKTTDLQGALSNKLLIEKCTDCGVEGI